MNRTEKLDCELDLAYRLRDDYDYRDDTLWNLFNCVIEELKAELELLGIKNPGRR